MTNDMPLIVRVMPSADELELTVSELTTPNELISHILDADIGVPRTDAQSNQIAYQLIPKGKNEVLKESETFLEGEILPNDVILMIPKVIAG